MSGQLGLNLRQLSIPGAFRDNPTDGHNRRGAPRGIVAELETARTRASSPRPESATNGPAIVSDAPQWTMEAAAMDRRLLPPGTWRGELVDGTGQVIPLSECVHCGHRAPFHPDRPWYFDHDCSPKEAQ